MANLFPDIHPNSVSSKPWTIEFERYQEREPARSGFVQINSYDPTDQIFARGIWEVLSRSEYEQVEDHWKSYATAAFDLFDFEMRKLRGIWIAVANGTSTTYTLPAKAVATPVIKHNGVAAVVQPTLSVGTGLQGEDQIVYPSGDKPGSGVILTLDAADGRQLVTVNYGITRWPGGRVEAEIYGIPELTFIQKVTG